MMSRRTGQFFIITAVLVAGALLTVTNMLASSQTVDYNNVLERHGTDVLGNVARDISSEWWNTSWSYRKNVVVEERSGLFLENESISLAIDARDGRVNDTCAGFRAVSDGETIPWVNTTACGIDTYESETGADVVARYLFDSGGGATAVDATGHGHDGALVGDPQWVSGRFAGGLGFDADDSVEVPDSDALDFTGDGFTVTFWLHPRDSPPPAGWRQLFVKGDGQPNGGRNYAMWLRPNANTIHFRVDPNNQGIGATATALNPGRWHHVAGVYNAEAEELRVYIDGNLDGQAGGVTMDGNSDNDGALHIGESPNFDGGDMVVDDFRIYNRSLSPSTIEGVAQNGIGLDVGVDLTPLEEKTLQVYYGTPFTVAHPEHTRASLVTTAMDERPSASVGTARSVTEIMRKLQQRVEQVDAGLGAKLQLVVQRGCNRLRLRSPQMVIGRDIC